MKRETLWDVLKLKDLAIQQQALVALFGDQDEGFLKGEFLRQRKIERNQNFALRVSVFGLPSSVSLSVLEGLPDLLRRVFAHGPAALAAVQLCDMRPKHLHVIANLGHRAHRGTGSPDGVALLDGDGGRDAFNAVHLGLVHAVEELPRVGREGLDIAPLALREQGVERQGTLARAAQASDDDKLVERHIEIEVLEVVVADAPEADDWPHRRFQHVGSNVGWLGRGCKLQPTGRALQQNRKLGRIARNVYSGVGVGMGLTNQSMLLVWPPNYYLKWVIHPYTSWPSSAACSANR